MKGIPRKGTLPNTSANMCKRTAPQGLKPASFVRLDGSALAVPFPKATDGTALVAEGDADGSGGADYFSVGVDHFHFAGGVDDVDGFDGLLLETDHLAELAGGNEVDGGHAEAGG